MRKLESDGKFEDLPQTATIRHMSQWNSIDGERRQVDANLSPAEQRLERARCMELALDEIKCLRSATLSELMAVVERRRVEHLIHFTRVENLEGILRFGLIPPVTLDSLGLPTPHKRTDKGRIDGLPEASCLSVTNPNYFMFEKVRGDGKNWVILGYAAEKVLQLPSIFFDSNAASGGAKYRHPNQLKYMRNRATPPAFEKMFVGGTTHRRPEIESNETADSQAEVLVFETIPSEMMVFIAPCKGKLDKDAMIQFCPESVEWLLEPSVFRSRLMARRADDAFWRSIYHFSKY